MCSYIWIFDRHGRGPFEPYDGLLDLSQLNEALCEELPVLLPAVRFKPFCVREMCPRFVLNKRNVKRDV